MAKTNHPGEFLKDQMAKAGIRQADLSRASGITFQRINGILHGRRGITPDSALRIEAATGLSATELLILQASYDLAETRKTLGKELRQIKRVVDAN